MLLKNKTCVNSDVCEYTNMTIYISERALANYMYSDSSAAIATIVMPIILIVGLLSNSTFIFAFFRIKKLRNIVNYCLVNLAFADIVYLSIVVTDKVARYHSSPFFSDYSLWKNCKLAAGLIFMLHMVSELTIAALTIERYVAICRPTGVLARMRTKKRALVCLAFTWILGVILVLPCSLVVEGATYEMIYDKNSTSSDLPKKVLKCSTPPVRFFKGTNLQCYAIQSVPFFFTAVIVLILNIFIIRKLKESMKIVQKLSESNSNQTILEERKVVVRMLIVTTVVFYCLVFPYYIDDVLKVVENIIGRPLVKLPSMFLMVGRMLSYLNSAVNVIIYSALSARYRAAIFAAFCPCYSDGSLLQSDWKTSQAVSRQRNTETGSQIRDIGRTTSDSALYQNKEVHISQHALHNENEAVVIPSSSMSKTHVPTQEGDLQLENQANEYNEFGLPIRSRSPTIFINLQMEHPQEIINTETVTTHI